SEYGAAITLTFQGTKSSEPSTVSNGHTGFVEGYVAHRRKSAAPRRESNSTRASASPPLVRMSCVRSAVKNARVYVMTVGTVLKSPSTTVVRRGSMKRRNK